MTSERTLLRQETFGRLLRDWRRKQGLSQGDFGQLLDPKARHSTVSCWEKGIRLPSRRFLGQIVALTGIAAELALGVHEGRSVQKGEAA